MDILNNLENKYNKDLSLILGFFDGLHQGHRAVIQKGVQYAKDNGIKSALITFRNSPSDVLQNKQPQYILTTGEKIDKIEELGVDYLYIINFDEELSKITASDYLKMLVEKFHPKAITTGENHSFGYNKSGNSDYLELMKKEYGYEYFKVQPVNYNEEIISSSRIKTALHEGNINLANLLLGYRFYIKSDVIRGRHVGSSIGFKTANLKYSENLVKIPDGVYAAEIEINEKKYIGIANYGSNPTVTNSSKKQVEVHILNFDENIYGETIKINFLDKIRDEIKFNSLNELKEQITKDIECLEL